MRQPDFAGAARALQAYQNYRSRLSRMSIEAREAGVQPVLSDDETAGQDRRTASPSVPVESREQPRELSDGDPRVGKSEREIFWHDAAVENWENGDWDAREDDRLWGVVWRLMDIVDGERDATIRELRAEAAREFESGNEWCQRALASEAALETTRAERDRARDLAAHLAASVVKLADDWDEETQAVTNWDSASMARRTAYRAVTRDLRALAAHLEAEHAQ